MTTADVRAGGATGTVTAVAGASGFVGRRLCRRLDDRSVEVRALGRRPEALPRGEHIEGCAVDVGDESAVRRALRGVGTAWYLVHAMGGGAGFSDRDRQQAETFARAAADAGVRRIVYLGGLGRGGSEHLASRQEVGRILRAAPLEVVELRAAVVLGAGSISFEMLRYLTERLPVMVCPRWVDSRLQPIGEHDLLDYLEEAGALEGDRVVAPGTYEVGSPDVTTYAGMMRDYAALRGLRQRRILKVPLLTPSLSARWVDVVTPVDRQVSHSLVESLREDVVVEDCEGTDGAFGVRPEPVGEALRRALDEQAGGVGARLLELGEGLHDGVYVMRAEAAVPAERAERVSDGLDEVGGDLGWYGVAWAWRLRQLLGRVFGEQLHLRAPERRQAGERADWWRIVTLEPGRLVLASVGWFFGEGWLGYEAVSGDRRGHITQVAAFRPRGLGGLAYWKLLWPVHRLVFRAMARRRADPEPDEARHPSDASTLAVR